MNINEAVDKLREEGVLKKLELEDINVIIHCLNKVAEEYCERQKALLRGKIQDFIKKI